VEGTVAFVQKGERVEVSVELSGFDTNDVNTKHGFHIHADSDLSESCSGAGGHYNPTNKTHGAPTDTNRHVGDLGNIEEDESGEVRVTLTDSVIELSGEFSIIGKAVVVHEGEDDLGTGGDKGSMTTGNAGSRLACCVIEEEDEPSCSTSPTPNLVLAAALTLLFSTLLHL